MNRTTKLPVKEAAPTKYSLLSKGEKSAFYESTNSPADQVFYLHQTLGNRAVSRIYHSGILQAKLKIGLPNDIYEQEADRVAGEVMRMPEPAVQFKAG